MTCKSCGSDNCGNHAACERRTAAFRTWNNEGTLTWLIIGIAEDSAQRVMKQHGPRIVLAAGGPPAYRREAATITMQTLLKKTAELKK